MVIDAGRILRQTFLRYSDRPALINIERNRRFTYMQMHDLSNRMCNFLYHKFGLAEGDVYATIIKNDNMALFYPWMLKSPSSAVWLYIRESFEEQVKQIDYVEPRLVFIETESLPQLYDDLHKRDIIIVCMDRTNRAWQGIHYFWDLVEEAPATEFNQEIEAYDVDKHISVMRYTGGTTGKPKCAMYSFSNLWAWGCNPAHYYEVLPYENPRALLFSPLNHAASGSIIIPLYLKGGVVTTLNKADL